MPAVTITEYHTQVKDSAELGGERVGQDCPSFQWESGAMLTFDTRSIPYEGLQCRPPSSPDWKILFYPQDTRTLNLGLFPRPVLCYDHVLCLFF